jgi:hypothetical protein
VNLTLLSGNPKSTGLCRAFTDKIIHDASDGGANVKEINAVGIERCRVCGTAEVLACRKKDAR